MKKYFYPAVFEAEDMGFSVCVPDIPGCITEGDTLEKAFTMTKDAIGIMFSTMKDLKQDIPEPSDPSKIQTGDHQTVVIIEFDYMEYLKRNDSRAVKKTLSIPSWLNQEALDAGINFSQALQETLVARLAK